LQSSEQCSLQLDNQATSLRKNAVTKWWWWRRRRRSCNKRTKKKQMKKKKKKRRRRRRRRSWHSVIQKREWNA
jgi:hypothetical protein